MEDPPPNNPEAFEALEKRTFYTVQEELTCVHCDVEGALINKGVNGNLNAKGVRRISLLCRACNGPSFRLESALHKSGLDKHLKTITEALDKLPVIQLVDRRPKLASSSKPSGLIQKTLSFPSLGPKRLRVASPEEEPGPIDVQDMGETQDVVDMEETPPSPTDNCQEDFRDSQQTTTQDSTTLWKEIARKAEIRADKAEQRLEQLFEEIKYLREMVEQLRSEKGKSIATTPPKGSGVNGRQVPGLDPRPAVHQPGPSWADQVEAEEEQPWTLVQPRKAPTPAPGTYAAAAAKGSNPKRIIRKRQEAARRLFQPVQEPLKFAAIRIAVTDTRPLRNVRGKEREKLLRETAKTLEISQWTACASTIGNSVIEFYVTSQAEAQARQRLRQQEVEILEDFDPFKQPAHATQSKEACKIATVKRLTHLCLIAKVRNLQDAILKGASQEIRSAVLQRYRDILQNPEAVLGRESTSSMMTDDYDQ